MIAPEDDDGDEPPLACATGPLAVSSTRTSTKLIQRVDLVDGECTACVSVLPPDATHADLHVLLDINGDMMPPLFGFCGSTCRCMFYKNRLMRPYQKVILALLLNSSRLSLALQSKVRVGDNVLVHADPRTGIGGAILKGEGIVKTLEYDSVHRCAVFTVQTCDALVRVYPDGVSEPEHITPAMRRGLGDQTPHSAATAADQKAAMSTQRRYALDKHAEAKAAVTNLLDERVANEARLRDTAGAAESKLQSERDAAHASFRTAADSAAVQLRDARFLGRARLNGAAEAAETTGRVAAALYAESDARSADALSKARKRARVAESKAAASAPDAGEVAALKKQLEALQVLCRACARCAH